MLPHLSPSRSYLILFVCLFVCSVDIASTAKNAQHPLRITGHLTIPLLRNSPCRQDQYRFFSWIGLPLYSIILANHKPRETCNNRLTPSYASVCRHYDKSSCRWLLSAHVYNRFNCYGYHRRGPASTGGNHVTDRTVKLLSYWPSFVTPLLLWI